MPILSQFIVNEIHFSMAVNDVIIMSCNCISVCCGYRTEDDNCVAYILIFIQSVRGSFLSPRSDISIVVWLSSILL